MTQNFSICQISYADQAGGAEQVAMDLHRAYLDKGYNASLKVAVQRTQQPGVVPLGVNLSRKRPGDIIRKLAGLENLTRIAHADIPIKQDTIIHAHSLTGAYFNLQQLVDLSQRVPVFITLHDMWPMTGGCHHALSCERWRDSCGQCPALKSISRWWLIDNTQRNHRVKKELYAPGALHVITPSRWLQNLARESILNTERTTFHCIPNSVDTQCFHPQSQEAARKALGLGQDEHIVMFCAANPNNPWKDLTTVQQAVRSAAHALGQRITLMIIGGEPHEEIDELMTTRFTGFVQGREALAQWYNAVDIYLHAANAENFPNVTLEAMACQTPIIVTDTGGLREQFIHERHGFLVDQKEAHAMAKHMAFLLNNNDQRELIGEAARTHVLEHYSTTRQVTDHLELYEQILKSY